MKVKIPKGEEDWTYYNGYPNGAFVLTSNKDRSLYYLYKNEDGILTKVGKNKNPNSLESLMGEP